MYSISVDGSLGLVEVKLAGLMGVNEAADYIHDLKTAFIQNRLRSYAFLLDVTDCPIQQQDMLSVMSEHMATMPKARSIAVVVGGSLAKMQVRRLFTQPYARVTYDPADARAWVLDGIEPRAQPVSSSLNSVGRG